MANPRQYGFTDKLQKPFRIADLSELFPIIMEADTVKNLF